MTVHDLVIANASGQAVRTDLNNALAAIARNQSDSSAVPGADSYPYQWQVRTNDNKLYMRDGSTATTWHEVGDIGVANLGLAKLAGPTFTGVVGVANGTNGAPSICFSGDTDTGLYRSASNVLGISANGTASHLFKSDGSEPQVPLKATNGTVSAPSLTFASDTNLGLYRSAADTLAVTTGGTERAFVDSNGVTIKGRGDLRLSDSSSSNWAALQAPDNIGTNYTLTLPDDDGSANQILKTDGSGVLSWATADSLVTATTGGFVAYAILQQVENSGTNGGNSGTSWTDRVLNDEVDTSNIVTISSNSFTLGAGNYLIKAMACSDDIESVRLRIYDVTNSTQKIIGGNGYGPTFGDHNKWNHLIGRLYPTTSTTYKLQQISDIARNGNGHGVAQSLGGSEVYVILEIYKER